MLLASRVDTTEISPDFPLHSNSMLNTENILSFFLSLISMKYKENYLLIFGSSMQIR